ncbi:MAG: alpha/beta hydrolase [Herbiconiux sp.]|nr:alpha/beta hydrolase [Herbiconiux sp.]
MNPLTIAVWWARDYAYAGVWQLRSLANRTDPAAFLSGERTPLVVVPGVWETWKFLQPLIETLHGRGHPVHVIDPLHWNRRPVPEAAGFVADYLEQHDLRGVVLVAHSKGGLVGKYAMSLGPAAARVDAMLAVAAPFGGSAYARFMLAPSLRIFRPNDATLQALAREHAVNARIVSVYGRFDPHIPGGSALAGAKNVEVDTGGHFRILAHPRVLAELAALAE